MAKAKKLENKGDAMTIADLASLIQANDKGLRALVATLATKAEIAPLATKAEIATLATKAEIAPLATRAEIATLATKAEIATLATKAEIATLATKSEIANLATKAQVANLATKAEVAELAAKTDEGFASLEAAVNRSFTHMTREYGEFRAEVADRFQSVEMKILGVGNRIDILIDRTPSREEFGRLETRVATLESRRRR